MFAGDSIVATKEGAVQVPSDMIAFGDPGILPGMDRTTLWRMSGAHCRDLGGLI
jgi:hypothetical protein